MLLQIAIIGLATIAALNLIWLFTFRWPLSGQPARTPAPPRPVPPAAAPPPQAPDAVSQEAPEVEATVASQVVASPAVRPRGPSAAVRAGIGWLSAHWEEALAALIALGVAIYVAIYFPRPAGITKPGQFGHPFQGFHWVRDYLLDRRAALPIALALAVTLCSLGLFGLAIFGRRHAERSARAAHAGLLLAALGLAGVGQMGLLNFYGGPATLFYLAAVALFVVWALSYRPYLAADLFESAWPRWLEIVLLALTIGLTIFMRFYSLRTYQYGIEGDESKWTVEVINAMVDGVFPDATEFHISTMPLSFFMQAPFHWLLGPSILSARIAVATYSVLGSLVFYWLARYLTCPPVAWLATTLLAVSLLDVSASRLANVESHVKFMPLLALALLALATRSGKPIAYALAGTAVAAGMLTYDTVLPLAAVTALILVYEIVRARASFAVGVRTMSAFLAPILMITPITISYLSGRLGYYGGFAAGAAESRYGLAGVLLQNTGEVFHTLFVQTYSDFLYNREGPLFNSLLLPWLALGVVLALVAWRSGRIAWILLWGGLFFFLTPVATHSPMGRLFYPGLPAAYLLMAIGLYAAYRELGRALGPALLPALKALALVSLAILVVSNLYIYFNLVQDPLDRPSRRELYDISQAAAGPATMVYYPFVPQAGDPIEFEGPFAIWLGLRKPGTATAGRYPYAVVPLESLLSTMLTMSEPYERAEVIWWNGFSDQTRPQREAALKKVLACFPSATRIPGSAYDRYAIAGAALRAPACAR